MKICNYCKLFLHIYLSDCPFHRPQKTKISMSDSPLGRVCNHVIAVYSENKLQHYATAYRNHKSAGEKLCLVK